jgi:heme-degrading monooxygenase HmoA
MPAVRRPMPIKVLIKRHVKEGHVLEAVHMLEDFRRMAMREAGYISGETLTNHYDARSITVVSCWRTIDDWIRWQSSDHRAQNEANIEKVLEIPTKYEVYDIRGGLRGTTEPDPIAQSDEVS